jgi:hypothetical protein
MNWYRLHKKAQVKPFEPGEYVMRADTVDQKKIGQCECCEEEKEIDPVTFICESCEAEKNDSE